LLGVQVVPTIAFGSCDAGAAALDGMTLAWLVVGVWVAAWALRSMGRALGR